MAATVSEDQVVAEYLVLDGMGLTIPQLYGLMYNEDIKIKISENAWDRIKKSRSVVDDAVKNNEIVYGVTTGFGSFKDKFIQGDQLTTLQENLIKSHAVGCGPSISINLTRGMLALRINSLAKGNSGVSVNLIERLVEFFNQQIYSEVFQKGSVGASGDLAPLSHLMLGYLGYGNLWDPEELQYRPAKDVLDDYELKPLVLSYKEGLSTNNGTAFITTLAVDAIYKITNLFHQANNIAGLTVEALRGTNKAFDVRISQAKPHPGQIHVAKHLSDILGYHQGGSERFKKYAANVVQDAYSLRCMPQVHGVLLDTLVFATNIIQTEMNSSTDNPLIFDDDVLSGGNFHGQYPGSVCDYLSIALTTFGNISERRIERLVNGSLSKLPSFLVKNNPGLNSGCMILQYTASALCAENRCKSNPATVHSIPTCENQEDMVSEGAYAAVKLLEIVENVYQILAIELYCAVQAYEFIPERTTDFLENIVKLVRAKVPALDDDAYIKPHIDTIKQMLYKNSFLQGIN